MSSFSLNRARYRAEVPRAATLTASLLAVFTALVLLSLLFANLPEFAGIERMLESVYPADPSIWPGFTT